MNSYLTSIDLNTVINHPISLPQTQISAGETVVISSVTIEAKKWVDLSWLTLHVPRIAESVTNSRLITSTQEASSVVVASANFFSIDDVGSTIRWADGTTDIIMAYVGPTMVSVKTSRTLAPSSFDIIRPGHKTRRVNTSLGLVYVGLYTQQFFLINRPCGDPTFSLSLDGPGSVSMPVRTSRIIKGPDVISLAITNNSYDVNYIEAVVTGTIKLFA